MRCVFCGTEYPADTVVCRSCNDYKGLQEIDKPAYVTLNEAMNEVFAIMAEARQHHLDNPCNNPDCNCRECEHPNLRHTDSSAHLAFCPDCELEIDCLCESENQK